MGGRAEGSKICSQFLVLSFFGALARRSGHALIVQLAEIRSRYRMAAPRRPEKTGVSDVTPSRKGASRISEIVASPRAKEARLVNVSSHQSRNVKWRRSISFFLSLPIYSPVASPIVTPHSFVRSWGHGVISFMPYYARARAAMRISDTRRGRIERRRS